MTKEISVLNVKMGGNNPLVFIVGPCVIESEIQTMKHAEFIKKMAQKMDIGVIYKSSYDKANRSSLSSFRGVGQKEGLRILKKVRDELHMPVLSDIHNYQEAGPAGEVLDIIQIPAFLCRQTDLIIAASKTGKVVNIKKGQFLSPLEMRNIIKKVESTGNNQILVTERGTTFGYNNLVVDMRSIPIMRSLGYPVVFDATHSVQLPGAKGESSGGERKFVSTLACAAAAAGCDALFMEVHSDPDHAPCDGSNMIALKDVEKIIDMVRKINNIIRNKG